MLVLICCCNSGQGPIPDAAPGSDAGQAEDAGDPQLGDGWDEPSFEATAATIAIEDMPHQEGTGLTALIGTLYVNSLPDTRVEELRIGSCRFLTWEPAFCDSGPDCVCVATNDCERYPEMLSAGLLEVTGLLDEPFTLEPSERSGYWWRGPAGLFGLSHEVIVTAVGDRVPAFSVSAPGPERFEVRDWPLDSSRDYEVTWTPGYEPAARVRMVLQADRASHGWFASATIECDSADDGRIVVDREMIERFLDPSNWGCGNCRPSWIERYTRQVVRAGHMDVGLILRTYGDRLE